jgi:hypothetical protein
MDPARPNREYSGGEVYVPPTPEEIEKKKLGVNDPKATGDVGTRLNVRA